MNLKFALALIGALSPALASAQTADPQASLKTKGEGHYEVWCKITPTSGDETTRYLEPGHDTLNLARVRRASCNYKAGSTGTVTVTLSGTDWNCPFRAATDGACEQAFNHSSFGSFELKRKVR